ncbi:DUF1049 domain-containing protein [Arsenicitalea aurantiaca]|uniref:DUF1049 domain-containing protein n=1 Tax=Arsenicitalea aurantiaca TaxID=1783274 RepID=A0A433X8D9_9HYPH|nr:lipopolysaccharide assembly protein LapA domain-containing protein [Arsenicitalea aurantiaca]RUT30308.1 DUF1049 domain-containing protein [Arsenicitalea aurantiaca]
MVRRIAGWIVLVPLSAALIFFALANRQLVAVRFNPFGQDVDPAAPQFGVPLFLVIFAVLLVGVLLGGVAAWFAQAPHRQRERHWRREAEHLRRELDALQRNRAGRDTDRRLVEVDELMDPR